MTWIDRTDWHAERGRQLVQLMAQVYPDRDLVKALLQDSRIPLTYLPSGGTMGKIWRDLAADLQGAGLLRGLLDEAVGRKPQLAPALAPIDADDPAFPGNPIDRYLVRLVGPGRVPIIDRSELRNKLKNFIEYPMPVLIIKGSPRSGKSHSFELIKHVIGDADSPKLIWIDFAPAAYGTSAADLTRLICTRLRLEDVSGGPVRTTAVRNAAELGDALLGAYNDKFDDKVKRILVIDGLNRTDLQSDVYALIGKLVVDVVNNQFIRTQLVVTGYMGAFDRDLNWKMETDVTAAINQTHVYKYFEDLGVDLGRNLQPTDLNAMVATAMAGSPGLEDLADRVRTKAMELVAGP